MAQSIGLHFVGVNEGDAFNVLNPRQSEQPVTTLGSQSPCAFGCALLECDIHLGKRNSEPV